MANRPHSLTYVWPLLVGGALLLVSYRHTATNALWNLWRDLRQLVAPAHVASASAAVAPPLAQPTRPLAPSIAEALPEPKAARTPRVRIINVPVTTLPQPTPPTPTPSPMQLVRIPRGTELHVRWQEAISSSTLKPGDVVPGTLDQPLQVDGVRIAGSGVPVRVRVESVEPASKSAGARLALRLESIQTAQPLELQARMILVGRKSPSKLRRVLRAAGLSPREGIPNTNEQEAEYTGISAVVTRDGAVEIPADSVAVFRTLEIARVAVEREDPPWKYRGDRR